VEMFGGVLVLGAVATANMATGQAHAQVHPGVAGLQAVFAALGARRHFADFRQMLAFPGHCSETDMGAAMKARNWTFPVTSHQLWAKPGYGRRPVPPWGIPQSGAPVSFTLSLCGDMSRLAHLGNLLEVLLSHRPIRIEPRQIVISSRDSGGVEHD